MRPTLPSLLSVLGVVTLGLVHLCAVAQEYTSRPATRNEVVGFWQGIALPDSLKPKVFKQDPWPADCQFFSLSADGNMSTFFKHPKPCPAESSRSLSEAAAMLPKVITWEHRPPSMIIVKRTDVKNYSEAWQATLVLKEFSRDGAQFLPGDLILYMRNWKEQPPKTLYIRHWRRVPNG